jgi:hypothetical protein
MGIRIEGEDEVNEVVETAQQVAGEQKLSDAELDAENGNGTGEPGEEETTVVSIGEPPADASAANEDQQHAAPQWAKDLRKEHRRLQRELADERRKNAAVQSVQAPESDVLGPEPTLEQCGWDEAEFRKQTAAHIRKAGEIDARKERQAADVRNQQVQAKERLTAYQTQQKALKVPDFEDAEDAVVGTLSEVQQNILLAGADNAALIVYALGKNPDKARELAKLTDPVKFAFAAAKLEKEIKVTPRKSNTKPQPETVHRSSAALTGGGSTALDAARKKAEQTGDYTEVNAIRRQLRAAGRK